MNRIDPFDYLACPICLNSITRKKHELFCSSCNIFYSQLHGSSYSFLNEKLYSQRDFDAIKTIEKFWGSGWDKRLGEDDHSHFSKNDEEFKKYYHSRKKRPKFPSFGGLLDNEIHYDEFKGKVGINVGSGPGDEAAMLSYIGNSLCIPIDLTSAAVVCAHKTLHRLNCVSDIAIQADARFLPIKSNSLDYYYSSGVLHHSPDIKKSIEEAYRVLKPGGVAYIALYGKDNPVFLILKLKAFLKGKFSKENIGEFINANSETAWITDYDKKNPKTDLFSKSECERLLDQFSRVIVRKSGFRWNQIPKVGKFIDKVRPKSFPPGIAGLGGSNYITATK